MNDAWAFELGLGYELSAEGLLRWVVSRAPSVDWSKSWERLATGDCDIFACGLLMLRLVLSGRHFVGNVSQAA